MTLLENFISLELMNLYRLLFIFFFISSIEDINLYVEFYFTQQVLKDRWKIYHLKGILVDDIVKSLLSKLLVNLEFTTSSLIHFILWKINYIDLWTLE